MLFLSIIFTIVLIQPLFAVELYIYKSVAEHRQTLTGLGSYQQTFTSDEYTNIIDGSISWDGDSYPTQELYQTVDTLKGVSVIVRKSSVCECKPIKAKIVDPNTFLLQNSFTGAYFYADANSIEYPSDKPSDGGTTLKLDFGNGKTNFKGILSYLMRGITWLPNYDLFVGQDDSCRLQTYAAIRNNQQQEYQVDNTKLFSGDLQLVNNYQPVAFRGALKSAAAFDGGSQPIQAEGEQKGFYSYSLKNKYTLRPLSSIRLPFINVKLTCGFSYKTTTSVSTGTYKGVFQRNYDLTPNVFLPAGILTVRDNQVLVGQSNLPDVPEVFTQTVNLGDDYDVRYSIKGTQTGSSENNAKSVWRTYSLQVTISNYKNKAVKGQLSLYGAPQTTIDKSTCNSATVDATMINLPFSLKASQSLTCQLTVTLKW